MYQSYTMDTSNLIIGVNGSTCWNEAGCGKLVALFISLVRGLNVTYLEDAYKGLLKEKDASLEDLVVLCFQTRDIRGGKGERDLFYKMFAILVESLHAAGKDDTIEKLIRLIGEYGCYRDYIELLRKDVDLSKKVRQIFMKCIKDRLIADKTIMDRVIRAEAEAKVSSSISLLAKWLPRESGVDRSIARSIAKGCGWSMPEYRKLVSSLNAYLKTVEINMCGGTWKDIVPHAVPGRNMKIHKNAFLNMPAGKTIASSMKQMYRYPESEDRVECRENFLKYLTKVSKGDVTMKGANVLMPHEIIKEILSTESAENKIILEGQWKSIKEKMGTFNRIVCLSDFSGSMNGIPMLVSMAIGLLISESTSGAFRNRLLTFDSNPQWLTFSEDQTLFEKTDVCTTSPWGGSTDFEKAYQLVLDTLIAEKVPVGEEPKDLLVLTDMGWDQATSGHAFHLDNLKKRFREAGGWEVPRVIIWNLRDAFKQYQANEKTPGVLMISGWHPSVIKRIQDGISATTPYEGVRAVLDDERYWPLRFVMGGDEKYKTAYEKVAVR